MIGHAYQQGGGTIRDIEWDSKTSDFYMVGASGLENKDYQYPGNVAPVIRVDKDGNYHTMCYDIKPEDPNKPVKVFTTLYLDESTDPTDIYIGGTFNYYGKMPTAQDGMVYNVAKWDHEAQDWRPIGKGIKAKWVDEKHYPEGYPGLPALPTTFMGFLRQDFPRIRDLTTDSEGNLYAAGTLALLDETLPVKDRVETFGLARWDRESDRWVSPTTMGGFSRDAVHMSWLDEAKTQLLLTGGFEYDNAWRPLNGAAILDVKTGEVKPFGGGLMMASREQVVAPMIRHSIRGDEIWFGGLFDHAGANANSNVEAPVPSNFVAMWNGTKNLDPNAGLVVKPAPGLPAPKSGSKSHDVVLEAELTGGEGTITWWQAKSTGGYNKRGSGPKFKANVRVKGSDRQIVYYVSVVRPDGSEGGKIPVRIKVGAGN